ncbi:pyrroloquinoline quinone biosynthesis peptide chaperone PqqD [Nocardia sp. NPDC052316]|uniref:pyrroloquinoline quinone biosynthesis peptide chaperone PqqD n=1 Tax=Nocardia sp. NPDC052316 TaxID=3364329 RepID=UPI0037C6FDAF
MAGSFDSKLPRLRPGVRLTRDSVRGELALLPEGVVVLNDTAAAVLALCDGTHSIDRMVQRLGAEYDGVRAEDIAELLERLAQRRVVALDD